MATPGLNSTQRQWKLRRGFSLVEIMFALAVAGLVLIATSKVFFTVLSTAYYTSGKLQVSRDIRTFTSEMAKEARGANYFVLYESFTNRATPKTDGQTGDYLVLFFQTIDGDIYKAIGYYRIDEGDNEGPVRKHVDIYEPVVAETDNPILPAEGSAGSHARIVELSRGLANGNLFYNYYNRSVMVKGEMIHKGRIGQRATNTYNFTISPRG